MHICENLKDLADNDREYFLASYREGWCYNAMGDMAHAICEKYLKHVIQEFFEAKTVKEENELEFVMQNQSIETLLIFIEEQMGIMVSMELFCQVGQIDGMDSASEITGEALNPEDIQICYEAVEICKKFVDEIILEKETKTVDISDKISHRIQLVASGPSKIQNIEMKDLLSSDEENTYNIKLTPHQKQSISTGQGVRVSIGFPTGFNYDSTMEGVTFKAYHNIVDPETIQVLGRKEIPVTVTQDGLIITVDPFSPRADTENKTYVDKNLMLPPEEDDNIPLS